MKLQGILVFLFLTVGLIYGDEKATKTKVRCLTLFAPAHILFMHKNFILPFLPFLEFCGNDKFARKLKIVSF